MYNDDITFEWDEDKRSTNLEKHGIDFLRAKEIWLGDILEIRSPQMHHGEELFMAIGESNGQIITVIFTWRGRARRIISARKARDYEEEDYQNEVR